MFAVRTRVVDIFQSINAEWYQATAKYPSEKQDTREMSVKYQTFIKTLPLYNLFFSVYVCLYIDVSHHYANDHNELDSDGSKWIDLYIAHAFQ